MTKHTPKDNNNQIVLPPLDNQTTWLANHQSSIIQIHPVFDDATRYHISIMSDSVVDYASNGIERETIGEFINAHFPERPRLIWYKASFPALPYTDNPKRKRKGVFPKTEHQFEDDFEYSLKQRGIDVQRQVKCDIGRIDLLTNTHIYELKIHPSKADFFQAIGQVLLYKEHINRTLIPVVVFDELTGCDELIKTANALGIRVIIGYDEDDLNSPDVPAGSYYGR